MFNKLFVLCLTAIGCIFLVTVTECFAGIEEQKTQIISLIEAGDHVKADSETKKMVAEFSDGSGLDEAIHQIALKYQDAKNYQKEIELSRQIVANWPQSSHAVWAQMDIVAANLLLGNEADAKMELKTLNDNYRNDPNLPLTLNIIGFNCTASLRHEMAKDIFKAVIDKYPKSPHVATARLYLRGQEVLSLIDSNDYTAADAALDKLFADFAGYPELPRMAKVIGERYYGKGIEESNLIESHTNNFLEKAIKTFDRVINESPDSGLIPEICCWTGQGYYKLGKYEESLQRFQRVVNNYPNYEYAWNALFMVGRNYTAMGDSGLISKSDAASKTKASYSQLLERYPTCRMAAVVREMIQSSNSQ